MGQIRMSRGLALLSYSFVLFLACWVGASFSRPSDFSKASSASLSFPSMACACARLAWAEACPSLRMALSFSSVALDLCGNQIYGAFVLNRRVDLDAIDAALAR